MDRKMILLILASTVYCTSALLQDVPDFLITDNPSSTPTGIEGIVITSSFSCEGRVTRWRACLAHDPTMVNYRINFQVWRQRENVGFYILVGSNVLSPSTSTDSYQPAEVFDTYCVSFDVPQEEQISVIPEDFVGFHIEIIGHRFASTGGLLLSGDEAGTILSSQGTETQTPGEHFPLGNVDILMGAPLLDAIVGAAAGGSEDDRAPIATHTTTLTYTTSSLRVLPTDAVSSQRISPTEDTPSLSMAHTQSSHIPINATRAVHVPSEDTSTEDSVNRMTSNTTIFESPWLHSSISTHTLNTSMSVTNIGVDGSTSSGNDRVATVIYILVAVGVTIVIVSITLATVAVIFACKYNNKKQKTEGKVIKARAASEFIYNSSYESHHVHTGISTNPRLNSTGYRSHWSLTHSDSDSIHYSYPSIEVGASYSCDNGCNTQNHNRNGVIGSIGNREDQTTKIGETSEACLRNAVAQFQGISYLQRIKCTAKEKATKRTSRSFTHREKVYSQGGESDEGSDYDNPINKEEEEEKERTSEVVSVYYSEPIKRVEPTSIFLSENKAYDSRDPISILLSKNEAYSSRNGIEPSENEAYNAKNPTSILVLDNEAYESGNSGGISAESTSVMNTDSVYYASPTGTSSEEFEVGSNLAYGTSPSNIRLLQ